LSRELKLEDLQSFEDVTVCYPAGERRSEQRRSHRIVLEAPGTFDLYSGRVLAIRTADISSGGLSFYAPEQIGVATEGDLNFLLPIEDTATSVSAKVKVIYCFHTGGGTYKTGVEILTFLSGRAAMERLVLR